MTKSEIIGDIQVPPSKSHTLRAILLAMMGKGKSTISGYLASPDTMAMINAVEQFGAKVKLFDDVMEIEGVDRKLKRPTDVIQAGNSGQVLRFITAMSALVDSYVVITGDESIRTLRPIKPLLDTLTSQNVFAESTALNGQAPVIVRGRIKPGVMAIEGSDSQPVSALLFATSFLEGPSEIYVMNPGERPWIDVTLGWLSKLGIKITHHEYRHYKIPGRLAYNGFHVDIPGDFSSACFPMAAAVISKRTIELYGLDMNDYQADKRFIDILKKMNVNVKINEANQSIIVDGGVDLQGIKIDVNDCIDTLPILAVVGCFAKGKTEIIGAKIARKKECDRIYAIVHELRKMGGVIEENEDGLIVYPSKLRGAEVYSHKDHRIAMSLLIAGFGATGETIVEGVEYIGKTYPTFLYDFHNLGANIEEDSLTWA